MIDISNSPIEKIKFKNKIFHIKRDDLLHEDFSGNKARKFHYYLINQFPNIDTIVSYGSNQSNAMYSLSVLAKLKKWNFIYYVDHIPSYLEQNPNGNYKEALDNGMKLIIGKELFNIEKSKKEKNQLYIQEGGATVEASYGLKILANEIVKYCKTDNIKDIKVFLPSGTGTTALFLQKYLPYEVLTVPCVGNSIYLEKQFSLLEDDKLKYPKILEPKKRYHFGKLYKEHYILWQELKKDTDIEFDLLYDPIGWETLLNYRQTLDSKTEVIYLHQGGLKGNISMEERYLHKFQNFSKL